MTTKNILIGIAVLAILGGGYYWYAMQAPAEEATTETESSSSGGDTSSQEKLNMRVVCESALAYMTFPDGESAAQFVAECEAGEHPEVVERYKADMGYTDDRAI